jgi:hypothetical protein
MAPESEHPAAPEQVEHGFDEGIGRRPRSRRARRVGSFGDGLRADPDAPRRRRRFSEGIERDDA